MEHKVLMLFGEFYTACYAARGRGDEMGNDAMDVAGAVSSLALCLAAAGFVGNDAWVAARNVASEWAKSVFIRTGTAVARARAAWEYVWHNAKQLDAKFLEAAEGKICSELRSTDWKGPLGTRELEHSLPAVQAFYAYSVRLFQIDVTTNLSAAATRILRGIPADALHYREDRDILVQKTEDSLLHLPRRHRGLVATFAVPLSICDYFLFHLPVTEDTDIPFRSCCFQMLIDQLVFMPLRPRTLVVDYARPRLLNWETPTGTDCKAEIAREEMFGMISSVQSLSSFYDWGMIGPTFREKTSWSAKVTTCHAWFGITNRTGAWTQADAGEDTISSCIEVRRTFGMGSHVLARVLMDGVIVGKSTLRVENSNLLRILPPAG